MNDYINSSTSPDKPVSESKQKILDTALNEFAEHGFAGARVDRIASLAGVNKAMIYYHFASKENLYLEVIRFHLLPEIASLGKNLSSGGDVEIVLTNAARIYSGIFINKPQLVRILLRELANPGSAILKEIRLCIQTSAITTSIAKIISDEISKGTMRPVDFPQTLISFITLNVGYFLIHPVANKLLNIDDQAAFAKNRAAAIVDLFLNGVRIR